MLSKKRIGELESFAADIRINAMKSIESIGIGHVGGTLSIADLLAVLYGEVMNIDPRAPKSDERDWFVMSKGHSGPALYATLAQKGYFPMETLLTLNKPGTILPSHCDMRLTPGIDMSTGSLGQGISTALGVALSYKMDGKPNYVYVAVGDGECNEGQVWEGALFASAKNLTNVVMFIDANKKQLDGLTCDICDLGDIRKKFEDFGWFALEVDGHNVDEIYDAIVKAKSQTDKPSVIVLNTVKGKGVKYIEEKGYNHNMPVTSDDMKVIMEELSAYKE